MGRVDVDEMLDEMTPEDLTEWLAFSTIEPFGEPWLRMAMVCATVHNSSGYAKKPSKVEDFLPEFTFGDEKSSKPTDPEEQQRLLAKMFGAK